MKFLIDNQLPVALASWLVGKGMIAMHVLDLSMEATPDLDIWQHASREDWVVISKDEDFFHLANRPKDEGRLLWVRIGNCRRDTLLARFEAEWIGLEQAFTNGQRIVLLF